ncbi:MAG: hypothetical protein ACK4IY_06345, partial [Chitinophagales bacterium]
PVFFGPKHIKFHEALVLKEMKAAFEIIRADTMIEKLKWFETNPVEYARACSAAEQYVQNNKGGTDKIIGYILSRI